MQHEISTCMYKLSYTEHYEVEIDVIEMPWYNVCVQKV